MNDKVKQNLQIFGDREELEAQAARGEILKLTLGDVTWFERITLDNEHAIKKPKDPNRIELRGRPRGKSFYAKDIPLNLVKELKLDGLSGAEVARELDRRGYGKVSKDYANRKLREFGIILDSPRRGGRPREY